ncbi:unnamed protein product, partial [Meganyctiphanes norvegica]
EMSFINALRGPTVMNEAMKKMFIWLMMMMNGVVEFSSLESEITAYLNKFKAVQEFNPQVLNVLLQVFEMMKSNDFEAGKSKLIGVGEQLQSYLPADISANVAILEDIIPAAEKECGVTIEDALKNEKCPNGYVEIGTQCFLMTIEKVTWDTAKTRCEENEVHLASLKDPNALRDYVINNFPKSSFWVGGRYYRKP